MATAPVNAPRVSVSEELTLDQAVAHRAAVDDHERLAPSRALRVNAFREHVFAGARLALDENGRIRRRECVRAR